MNSVNKVQLDENSSYYGVSLSKRDKKSFYVSPPLVTGLTGGTDSAPYYSHIIECDFTSFADRTSTDESFLDSTIELPEEKWKIDKTDYVRIYFGDCTKDTFNETVADWGQGDRIYDRDADLNKKYVYYVEFGRSGIAWGYNNPEDEMKEEQMGSAAGDTGYMVDSKFIIKLTQHEDEYQTLMHLKVQMQKKGSTTWTDRVSENFAVPIARGLSSKNQNRLAFLLNTETEMDNLIKFSAAVDDENEVYGFNLTQNAFGKRSKLNQDITDRLLTVFTNNVDGDKKPGVVSDRVTNYMYQFQVSSSLWDPIDDVKFNHPLLENDRGETVNPNADFLGMDATSGEGIVTFADSNRGVTALGKVTVTDTNFPMFYVSIPSLPIQNYSASSGKGIENQFVCAVELTQSDTSSFYTGKIFTEQYNTLTNSQTLNIDNLRIMVTDINGRVIDGLGKYTTLVLEIKDDPRIENQSLNKKFNELMDTIGHMPPLIGYQ